MFARVELRRTFYSNIFSSDASIKLNASFNQSAEVKMSNSDIPTWFPAASNDRFQPNGQIVLGSLITNPKQPENSLNNPDELVTIPRELFVNTLQEIDHSSSIERTRGLTVGAQLKIAEFIDSELSHSWGTTKIGGINAARISSANFRPNEKYVAESVAKPPIVAYLKRQVGYFKKKAPGLFMITGVKVVHEATLHRSAASSNTTTSKASADFGGVQVAAGPFGTRTAEDKHNESFQPDGDFVYAVRLKKLVFRKRKLELEVEYYTDGAEIHGGDKKRAAEQEFEMELMSEEDVTVETLGISGMVGHLVLDKEEGLKVR
ncbi:hypothetical protein HYFRA_00014035 [Hymenoscyphus fraxineus]|uniref:Uncharacterized protein n=1 Tax=Hymenoscyphus fraxineus TaxID=746836 RepID=A0A9N9L7S9_9HELO|nr:hypothetical protein HYFRA_00014035 [Hymenoscyphus fraxineus]